MFPKAYAFSSVQFSSVTQSCPTLCDPMNCRTPGLPVHHQLPEFTQTHVHRVGDAIQPSHPHHPLLKNKRISTYEIISKYFLRKKIFQWVIKGCIDCLGLSQRFVTKESLKQQQRVLHLFSERGEKSKIRW